MEKAGRNDPCPCGSGKKFKKCCESKMLGKKFMATSIDPSSLNAVGKISSLFAGLNKEKPAPKAETTPQTDSNAESSPKNQ